MAQQHSQRNPILLFDCLGLPILANTFHDPHMLELRTVTLHKVSIVQRQFSLLNQLHGCYAGNHFRTGSDPEDTVEGHRGFGIGPPLTAGMLEKCLPGLVDDNRDTARNLVGVGCSFVHSFADAIDGGGG